MREDVPLQGQAGRVEAHLYLPKDSSPVPGVLLCHGFTSNKVNYAPFARFLQGEGFAVLAYDCRGHGESDGELDGEAWRDVVTALEYLQVRAEVDPERVGLVGSSMGAHNGLRAAAEQPSIRTAVCLNTAPSAVLKQGLLSADFWRLMHHQGGRVRVALPDYLLYLEQNDIDELPVRIAPRPLFFIHARDDELVPFQGSVKLRAGASADSRLWLLDKGGHRGPRHDPDVQRAIVDWLRTRLD